MKRLFTLLLAMVLVLSATAIAEADVTLRFIPQTSDEVQIAILNDYIKSGLEENFPNVEFVIEEGGGGDAYFNMIKVMAASDDLPDVWYSDTNFAQAVIATGNQVDLLPFISEDGFVEKLSDVEMFKAPSGEVYAIMAGTDQMHTAVVYYNKQIFADNGLEVPTTWDEFLALCAALKEKDITPLALGAAGAPLQNFFIEGLILIEDPAAVQALLANETDWSNPAITGAYEKLAYMLDNGYFNADAAATTTADAVGKFKNGESAMLFEMSWNANSLDDGNVGAFALPSNNAEYPTGSVIEYWGSPYNGYAVNANSTNLETAIKFAEYCSECVARYYNEQGTASALITGLEIAEPGELLSACQAIHAGAQVRVAAIGVNSMDSAVSAEWKTKNTSFVAGEIDVAGIIEAMNDLWADNTYFD